ncbi:iron-containing alcohol dehydrogenase [Olivibacter sp. SDN3]|uniref:iron-containing alcohol dehydrogenase n=1 Tax=Olivibacter sp. SDN3 TaxID=2764720 RepID=UPI00165174D6|nr:iron-containing alcohol dehydrogenase [Olivibacter sp. SDN3]QNL48392.1 iron-containing alcohol dehydrogenase [Olivibacter sp. SDN3]
MTINTDILKITFPRRMFVGNGTLEPLANEIEGSRILIITIPPLVSGIKEFIDNLKRLKRTVFLDIYINDEPSFIDIEGLLEKFKDHDIDTVIGIGGGSVLDVAKLLSVLLDHHQVLKDTVGNGLISSRAKRLICVPTTAGTGSEVSPNVILIDPSDDQKKGIISPFLVPDIVCIDPSLTHTVPQEVTAATGLDALTHCLEAYVNKHAHPMMDLYALEGIKLIGANILRAVRNGEDEHARYQVAIGSLYGGLCLGPVNTAGVHALAYPLGSGYHVPHGLSNALLLPHVMRYNIPSAPERYAQVAIALGCERDVSHNNTAKAGVEKIEKIIKDCKMPARLRDLKIPRNALPQMAEDAMKITRLLVNNPRDIQLKDALDIYNSAY